MSTEPLPDDNDPATKGDLRITQGELRELRTETHELRTEMRAIGVVVERVETQLRGLAEAMTSGRADLKNDMAEQEARISLRLARLEDAVRTNSRDIRDLKTDVAGLKTGVSALKADVSTLKTDVSGLKTDVSGLKIDMSELRQEVAELRRDFERRDAERLASLEARVTELEKRAGIA